MRKETNMAGVKSVAKALLMLDIHLTDYSPVIVQHPFTSSGMVAAPTENGLAMLDINGDGSVEICQYSPAGEDFSFTVDRKKFVDDVKFYYDNFDVDEHIEMWVKARGCGVSGIPSVRRLAIDAEEIEDMLQELACALSA